MAEDALTLAQVADLWHSTRQRRLAAQKQVDTIQEEEQKLKQALINGLRDAGVRAIGGGLGTATLRTKPEPTVTDWDAVYDHIRSTGEFELVYRRINAAAIKERWEAGVEVPGVQSIEVTDISWSKAK